MRTYRFLFYYCYSFHFLFLLVVFFSVYFFYNSYVDIIILFTLFKWLYSNKKQDAAYKSKERGYAGMYVYEYLNNKFVIKYEL